MKELERDRAGRHWSRLVIDNIQLEDSGEYTCQPAAGAPAHVVVTVHVQRETEVQAVLGEGQSVSQSDIYVETSGGEHGTYCVLSLSLSLSLSQYTIIIFLFKKKSFMCP